MCERNDRHIPVLLVVYHTEENDGDIQLEKMAAYCSMLYIHTAGGVHLQQQQTTHSVLYGRIVLVDSSLTSGCPANLWRTGTRLPCSTSASAPCERSSGGSPRR